MREILFRGKDEGTNEWVYGFYFEKPNDFGGEKRYYIFDDKTISRYNVFPKTVGQFTGLTDKKGNKIFEGDVFVDKGNETIDVVEFRNGKFCLVSYGIKGALMEYGWDENAGGFGECECCAIDDYYVDEIEFTHNIHDNPELLRTPQNDEVRE